MMAFRTSGAHHRPGFPLAPHIYLSAMTPDAPSAICCMCSPVAFAVTLFSAPPALDWHILRRRFLWAVQSMTALFFTALRYDFTDPKLTRQRSLCAVQRSRRACCMPPGRRRLINEAGFAVAASDSRAPTRRAPHAPDSAD